jgi:hypothetical protein
VLSVDLTEERRWRRPDLANDSLLGGSAAAAVLGYDPAVFLRTYAHLYPGDLKAVADAMDMARGAAPASAKDAPAEGGSRSLSRVDDSPSQRQREFHALLPATLRRAAGI